jgi:hypothetical protein
VSRRKAKAREPQTSPEPTLRSDDIAQAWGPPWLRSISIALAVLYLASVWGDAVTNRIPTRWLPAVTRPFVQSAGLFPHSAEAVIEWRVLGYRCSVGKFEELDVRPYFPIHADDKESRFDRALFFYHTNPRVLGALDHYISREASKPDADGRVDRIGGVILFSLRLPIPELGATPERYERKPLSTYAHDEKKYWYTTSTADRERRCGEGT